MISSTSNINTITTITGANFAFDQDREMIEQAKAVLMERNSFSEDEAHRYIQKRSMDNGTGLVETAQMILSLMTEV